MVLQVGLTCPLCDLSEIGPLEATIGCSLARVQCSTSPRNIGKVFDNTLGYVFKPGTCDIALRGQPGVGILAHFARLLFIIHLGIERRRGSCRSGLSSKTRRERLSAASRSTLVQDRRHGQTNGRRRRFFRSVFDVSLRLA